MHNRMTSRRKRTAGNKDGAPQGNLRVPSERDESADSQSRAEPSAERVGRAAQADTERGVADTSKGAELGATYEKLRKDSPDPEKKFRP